MRMLHHPSPRGLALIALLALIVGCDRTSDSEPPESQGGADREAVDDSHGADEPAASPRGDGPEARGDQPADGAASTEDEAEAGGNHGDGGRDGDGDGDGSEGAAEAADAADVEAAIAEVQAMVQRAEFAAAYQRARAMQRRFQNHPQRRRIDRLVARMAQLNREARGLDRLIDKLDDPDTEVRHIARQRIVRAGEAGLIALRHAVRTREDPTAVEAANLLASTSDPRAGALFARRLRDNIAPALHEALATNLRRVAPDADPEVLATLLPIIERDAAQERLDIAGYLINIAAEAAGQDPERWAELFGDDQAYPTIRHYIRQAIEREDQPELVDWASDYPVSLNLLESGLHAELFKDTNLTDRVGSRLVKRISHDKRENRIEGLPGNSISARWTGQLHVPRDGRYTLYTSTDDGVRLWINGEKIVDQWRGRAETEDRAQLDLDAGLHDLRLEWYQGGGDYAVHLRWEGPEIEKQHIGPDHLRTPPWAGMDHDLDD